MLSIDRHRSVPGYSIRRIGETKFVADVALVAIVALIADVLRIGWVSLKLCSNIIYRGTSISHSLAEYSEMVGHSYEAQSNHIAGNSVNSCTPGATYLFLAVW